MQVSICVIISFKFRSNIFLAVRSLARAKSPSHLALGFLQLALGFLVRMVKGFPVEDCLDGASNYGSWKLRVLLYLEENEVKEFALTMVSVPNDVTQLVAWKRNDVKAQKILMDSVKNYLVSHFAKSKTTKEMFHSSKKLFERDSASRSISLRTQLHTIRMNRSKSVASYFMRIADLRDPLDG